MFITGPFLITKTEAIHLCTTYCSVMYCTGNTYANAHAHKTQQDKTTVITCRILYYPVQEEKKITKLLQDKFSLLHILLKVCHHSLDVFHTKIA
jgi:hypothetical protein